MKKGISSEATGFGFLVRDVSKLIRRRFEKKSGTLGLTQAQWSVIGHLMHHEGINQAALAEMMGVEPIVLVGLLDKLERAGWVERRRDPEDRRARRLYLTRQIAPLLEKMDVIRTQVRQETFAGVSTQDQKQIIHILHKVKDNLSTQK